MKNVTAVKTGLWAAAVLLLATAIGQVSGRIVETVVPHFAPTTATTRDYAFWFAVSLAIGLFLFALQVCTLSCSSRWLRWLASGCYALVTAAIVKLYSEARNFTLRAPSGAATDRLYWIATVLAVGIIATQLTGAIILAITPKLREKA